MNPVLSAGLVLSVFASQLIGVAQSTLAHDPPRACNTDDPVLDVAAGTQDVGTNGPGVVVKGDLTFSYSQVNYDADIYGLAEADPHYSKPPYKICRRYEFQNTSGGTIKELRWPDIGVGNISETPPGKRYRFPKAVLSNSKEVGPASTILFAWENKRALSRTVFPLKTEVDKKPRIKHGFNWIYDIEPKAYAAALDGIDSEGLLIDATQSFYLPDETFAYPPLTSGIESDDVRFLVSSSAVVTPEKKHVNTYVEIQGFWKRKGQPVLFAPGIATLAGTKFATNQNIQDRIRSFAGRLSDFGAGNHNALLFKKTFFAYPIADDTSQPILFVVDQPVRFSAGDWSGCVMASVYGPIPISLSSEKYCGG